MIDASLRTSQQQHDGRGIASTAVCVAFAVLASAFSAVPAAAGPKEQPAAADDHYQVYIGRRDSGSYMLNKEWGSLRLATPSVGDTAYTPSLSAPSGGTGMTYFTPSVSGVRVGVGFAASPTAPGQTQDAAGSTQYTDLGPRTLQGRDAAGKWQVGGTVEYSGLELGANVGDHSDPTCAAAGACKTNDFWDVGVALRIGSGAISAGYTASQPRGQRPDEADRVDIFSLNAGYKITPGMDIFGGVDWIDTHSPSEAAETPVDTRFMLGTNLRF